MKRKNIILVMLFVLTGLFVIQSCSKDESPTPVIYKAAVPANPAPANNAVVTFTGAGQTLNLTWDGTATNAVKWDVYFGTSSSPSKVATDVTSNAYSTTIQKGGTFYWQVITVDANNVKSTSPVWQFEVNSAPTLAVPNTPVPALSATGVSCTPTLKWRAAIDAEGDALTYDLYLGTASTPALFGTAIADTTVTLTSALTPNTLYYWKIIANDPYGESVEGPVWSFTTGDLPIAKFTGAYTVDEPAEGWTYDANFTMLSPTTISDDSYWASWAATFTLDLTKLTYNLPLTTFTSGYSGIESGVLDPSTGTMTGTYTIFHNGNAIEQGVHTYTKK